MPLLKKYTIKELYVRWSLGLSGIVIAAPGIIGAMSTQSLTRLYGVENITEIETVLLQHRAILLALIGASLVLAIFHKNIRFFAVVAALVSNVSFILLVTLNPLTRSSLGLIAGVDVLLSLLLFGVLIIKQDFHKHRIS